MKKLIAAHSFLLLCITMASTHTNSLTLITDEKDYEYEGFKIFLDESSIKKTSKNIRLFNLISYGLSIDEELTYETPISTNNPIELQNQDNSKLIISAQINCSNKVLTPIQYLSFDINTGTSQIRKAKNLDTDSLSESNDELLNKIYKLTCSKEKTKA